MNDGNRFAVGDIVKLKSGGPDMTIRVSPDTAGKSYVCQWFAGKKLEQGNFPEDSLTQVEVPKP